MVGPFCSIKLCFTLYHGTTSAQFLENKFSVESTVRAIDLIHLLFVSAHLTELVVMSSTANVKEINVSNILEFRRGKKFTETNLFTARTVVLTAGLP